MIKFIASDLDGTLLKNGAQTLPQEMFPLIRQLKEMGILFAAASGRQYANMVHMFEPVADDMAFIAENGAIALWQDELLYQEGFDSQIVREVVEAIDAEADQEFTCSTKDFYYIKPKSEHFRDLMLNVVKNVCKEIQSFDEITEPCMKMAVYSRTAEPDELLHCWKERFGERCTVVTSGNRWVDFIPFTTNKALGLSAFQKKFGFKPEECLVFGDEYNDLAMLKAVPYSFAMSHAKEGVRACASYETDSVEEILRRLIASGGDIEPVLKNL